MHSHFHGRHRGRSRQRRRGRHSMWRGFRTRFFGPGELRLALLALLGEGPKHGYELMKQLEARSGGLYRASAGSVYPTLQQLEDEDLVRSRSEDGKKIYELTHAGREELEHHADQVRRIWRRAGGWKEWGAHTGPEAAEIWSSWGRLTKTAFKAAARAGLEETERIREILDRARRELEEI